jgi:hypothetical protein
MKRILLAFAFCSISGQAGQSSWQLHPRDGAGGYLLSENAQIIKTNGVGTMDLVSSRIFAVRSNGNYILRLPYLTEDASLGNLPLLRYTFGTNDSPELDAKNAGFAIWTGQSLMRNSPPGQWDRVARRAQPWAQ